MENSNFQPYNTLYSYSWKSWLKTQISDFIFVLQQDGWTFFKWQKQMRQRFLWVSCPFNWSLRIQSITAFPLTVLKSVRPKWFYLWAAGMLHWSDKDRFQAILAHTVTFSDFPFSCTVCSFLGEKANFLKFLINYFKTFHSFVPVRLYTHLNRKLIKTNQRSESANAATYRSKIRIHWIRQLNSRRIKVLLSLKKKHAVFNTFVR